QGNLIGTDATGMNALGNVSQGIFAAGGNSTITIGGTVAGARNVISANGFGSSNSGITVNGPLTTVIQGNLIGTAINGSSPLPNGRHGIEILDSNVTVGGVAPGAGN